MANTTSINADTTPQVLQTYALLQIAAEAVMGIDRQAPASNPGTTPLVKLDDAMLQVGNLHSSKMTAAQATEFAQNWKVVSHQPNTATGFSATLFEYVGTDPQPTASKYVVSFRSTEFIEDQVRDSKATNELEIKEGGWAFGQISDMRKWYAAQVAPLLTGGNRVNVTGYSLGGHLATAFYELYSDKAG